MAIDPLLKEKREEILQIAERHGARNVRVFGSAARGESGPQSDVDLLVDVGPDRTPFFPGGLLADLEELLGRKVDIVTEEALHWYIRERILEEAFPL
ncbi:MAG: DNA polymerase subunit beta [Candidatus Abyssobacteria bacterium SURF_5]|uniref:DNA polymerase subunit beta n=1 Tax=Abyssobacteria bacterium (strain SURF_5) TaxID=2093360 RepID=A0A3A4P071_ABYX5|nr:MAG: DNA polymerase subunit beta [Candidatus Abyssubacteria bacterium SURF_5]